MKSRWLSTFIVLALAVLGLTANVAYSQTTGEIEGTVADSNGAPLPGVAVEIKSSALQGTRTGTTDAAGRFRFPALAPGAYTVTAALSGFTKVERTNVRVALGATASLSLTLSVSVKEEVIVTGEAPVIDTTKTVIGTSATAESIARLPLGRNFSSIANRAPGTGTDNAGGVTIYGATSLENQYVIDGVNTSAVKGYQLTGAGTAVGIGNQGKNLNPEFVQEVEVKTGGYEAEFGRALGGVINVVTKSGGNDFHGDVFGYYSSPSIAAADAHATERAVAGLPSANPSKVFDVGVDLGGYFMKDRVWFFGAYDRTNRDTDFTRQLTARIGGINGTELCGAACPQSTGTQPDRNNLFSGKLTFRLGESNTIAASVFGDPGTTENYPNQGIGPDSTDLQKMDTGATDFTGKYDGIFGTQFLAQAQFSLHQEKSNAGPQDPAAATVNAFQKRQSGFLNEFYPGSGFDAVYANEKYKRYNYKLAGTFFAGNHEIKAGVDYENIDSSFAQTYPGPAGKQGAIRLYFRADGSFRYSYNRYYALFPPGFNCLQKADGSAVAPGEFVTIPNCGGYQPGLGDVAEPNTKNLALFAQDSWKVLRNLTVNAGIRYEQQKLKGLTDSVYAGIDLKNEWSPRLGVVWDPLNNGRSKVFGSYGRFYTTIPQDIQTRSLGREAQIIVLNTDRSGVLNPIDTLDGGPALFTQTGDLVNPDLKGMYQDEIIGGFEFEFAKNWSFGLKGIYKGLGRMVEDRCDTFANPDITPYYNQIATTDDYVKFYQPSCAAINVGGDGLLNTIKDPADKTCYPNGAVDFSTGRYVTSSPCTTTTGSRHYRGIQLDLAHHFAQNYFFQASYILSRLEGNYSGNLSQTRELGQFDPNINADFDYPGLVTNAYGLLRNDSKHQIKVTGYYAAPFGLTVGANYTFASGRPRNIFGCPADFVACNSGYDQEGFIVPRGSAGTMPSVWEADLHFEYAIRIGQVSITPVVNIFNVFNKQAVTSDTDLYNNQADNTLNGPCTDSAGHTGYLASCAPNVNYGKPIQWQSPRRLSVGARVSF